MTHGGAAFSEAERAARDAYGRLVASLAVRFRDVAAAEDAVADALVRALERWPQEGVPDAPEAWLMTTAKRRLLERVRHREVTERFATDVSRVFEELVSARAPDASHAFADERLALMFVCAHPAIDGSVHTPLMLQTVLGLDAEAIASAFLVSPTAMSQRLVRAKQKIKDAGIPFERPDPACVSERLDGVLEAIYAAFGLAWDADTSRETSRSASLAEEAIFLVDVLERLVPDAPEVLGLHSLMQLSRAREAARSGASGAFVPLGQQDVSLWDRQAILVANARLNYAASLRRPGPYQLEAAIQSAHCQRLFSGVTPWRAIVMLYAALSELAPTTATTVGHAAALLETGDLEGARERLDDIDVARSASYQPYWIVRAELAKKSGDDDAFLKHLERGIGLTESPALRRYLAQMKTTR